MQIVFEPWNEPIRVAADKSKLFEVVSNLLRNAIKFTDKGIITVSVEKQDGHAIVKVKDTGEGIDSEIMPRLFEKFATTGERIGGTGLGLYISRSIVEAHGGKIWGFNNKDGRGATFVFSLPIRN